MANLVMTQVVPTQVQGEIAFGINPSTIPAQVYASSTNTIIPGDMVKIIATTASQLIVDKAAATDTPFGVVLYGTQKNSFTAGDMITVAFAESIVVASASGAVSANDELEFDATNSAFKTSAGVNPIVAKALTGAADGGLFFAYIRGQLAFAASITSGTINGAPIGQSTAAAGSFTTLTASGTLSVTGDITASANIIKSVASLSGAGAIPVTADIVKLTTTAADALTLADGVDGQELVIIMIADGGAGTLTPSNPGGFSTLTFDDVGDSAHLVFTNSKWYLVGTPTATKA
jgi:hypothetical protein